MIKSIQHFEEFGIKNLEKIVEGFMKDPKDMTSFVYGIRDVVIHLEKVKKIYLNADGGGWIQAGKELSAQITYVLDEFHLKKYLLKLTGHMMDSAEDARKELCSAIKDGTKADFKRAVKRITGYARTENE